MSEPLSLYTALRLEESRTGERVLSEWLEYADWSECWWDDVNRVSDAAASAIILGDCAKWCSGRGIAVVYDPNDGVDWWRVEPGRDNWFVLTATDALSAFGEATLAALRAMPTKGGE